MKLFTHLFNNDVFCCGTFDTRRVGVSTDIRNENSEPGEMIVRQKDPLIIVKWRESKSKKPCVMLTSVHNGQLLEIGKSKKKRDGSSVRVRKPTCVLDYNKHMGGVDKSDQMVNDYANTRKTMKWPNILFIHLVDIACFNAFQLFLKRVDPCNRKGLTHLEFILQVVEAIMEEYKANNPLPKPSGGWSHPTGGTQFAWKRDSRSNGRRTHRSKTLRREGRKERRHKIVHNAGKTPFLTCFQKDWISLPKGLSHPNICCPKCEMALHSTPCFKIWHTTK